MAVIIQHPHIEQPDPALLERWRPIPVAIAVDVSSAICQIDPAIRPLRPAGQQPRLFGRAVTALCEPPDFGAVLYAIDRLQPGDVLVIAANADSTTAMIGEILGGQVRRRGGVGIICDGAIRDVAELATWDNFPVFARSITPRGPIAMERGVVNATITIGGCTINPGDLIIGDADGLAALDPVALQNYITAAEAKQAREQEWQTSLANGNSVAATFGLP